MEDFEILFVDDDRTILELVKEYLSAFNYHISVVDNGLKALELIKERDFDVVFTDFKMPDIDGLELLAVIKEYRPETEVIIVTGHGTMESAVKAMKIGSYDYIQKPFKLDVLKIVIDKIFEEKRLKQENIILRTRLKQRHRYASLVGISLKMQEIYEQIDRMRSGSPNVLIQGESGTGKELTAHVIHRSSERKDRSFVAVNCKSLTRGVAADRLHDHAMDLLQSARAATIFFDEITDIAPSMQVELSRVYQDLSAGSDDGVRLIAATSKQLQAAGGQQILDKDFLGCISDVTIQLPALRERKEDICLLINHFLDQFNRDREKKVLNVSAEALDLLLRYNWPGNVIQLENVIERAFALGVDPTIEVEDLPSEIKTFGEVSKSNFKKNGDDPLGP